MTATVTNVELEPVKTLREKMAENQTLEKSALIVAGSTLLSAGLSQIEKNPLVAIILIVLGVICLVLREIVKLKR